MFDNLRKDEIRVRDEATGGEKGQKIQRYDLLPWDQLDKVAELYGKGALKYAARNWEKGYVWSSSYASAQRHMKKFWQEHETLDEETQCHHLASAIFHLLALMRFEEQYPEKDDRSPYTKPVGQGWNGTMLGSISGTQHLTRDGSDGVSQ
jgi:hypothetical protein